MTRRVATQAGVDFYGKPIGSVIEGSDGSPVVVGRTRPVTLVRLRSLQRQFLAAKRTGSKPVMAAVQKQFSQEVKLYAQQTDSNIPTVLDELDSDFKLSTAASTPDDAPDSASPPGGEAPVESSEAESAS